MPNFSITTIVRPPPPDADANDAPPIAIAISAPTPAVKSSLRSLNLLLSVGSTTQLSRSDYPARRWRDPGSDDDESMKLRVEQILAERAALTCSSAPRRPSGSAALSGTRLAMGHG